MTANEVQHRPDRPAISIIVPIHNVERYLRECLDSVVNQTLSEIEIVCVDDASTDGSPAILGEYAAKDARIRVITFSENRSLSQARKDGVLGAAGEYILFLDADDYLDRRACEVLLEQMRKHRVDILHFGTRVINAGNSTDRRIESIRDYTRPYGGRLEGKEVFEGFFRRGLYRHTLWNKMYTWELCQRAFALVEDGSFPKAQELYAFTLLAFFARSYQGLPDVELIHYRFGSGVTGQSRLRLDQMVLYCAQSKISGAIRRFLEAQGVWEEYRDAHAKVHRGLLEDCVRVWLVYLAKEDQPRGFDLLVEHWGAAGVIACLAEHHRNRRSSIARSVRGARALECRVRPIRTVGTYCKALSGGGKAHVVSKLLGLWQSCGYRVVLFTEKMPDDRDYPLPEGVQRVVLPGWQNVTGGHRAWEWESELARHAVDVLVYHESESRDLLWDVLILKSLGLPMVVHSHATFISGVVRNPNAFKATLLAGSLCDAWVALTSMDRAFWSQHIRRAFELPPPLTADPFRCACSPLNSPDILWVGSFSPEKRPMDAVKIFQRVVEQVPDARLLMLGKRRDLELYGAVLAEIDRSGLHDRIKVCPYQNHLGEFWVSASVYLSTSRYEGVPPALLESKCHGVPGVMYRISHLVDGPWGQGMVSVGPGDVNSAAEQIVRLFQQREIREQMGQEARESARALAAFDLKAGWEAVFRSLCTPAEEEAAVEHDREAAQTMLGALISQIQQEARGRAAALEQRNAARKEAKGIRRSLAFRLGKAMLGIPGFFLRLAGRGPARGKRRPAKRKRKAGATRAPHRWVSVQMKGVYRVYSLGGLRLRIKSAELVRRAERKSRIKLRYIEKTDIQKRIRQNRDWGLTREARHPRVIVSLTSYPKRMHDIRYALHSLLEQTFKPDAVVLWLADDEYPRRERDVPRDILAFRERGLSIQWHKNLRVYGKLVPSLKAYPDDIVVTADDDIYYPPNWLEALHESYRAAPEFVHAHRAHRIRLDAWGDIRPYNQWLHSNPVPSASFLNMCTGVGGVWYPPHALHPDAIREELFMKLSPRNDDLWYWAMAVLHGVKIAVARGNITELIYVNPERELGMNAEEALSHTNTKGANDRQLGNILEHYPGLLGLLQQEHRAGADGEDQP